MTGYESLDQETSYRLPPRHVNWSWISRDSGKGLAVLLEEELKSLIQCGKTR